MIIPDHLTLTYSADQIKQGVSDVAQRIENGRGQVLGKPDNPFLAVCVLRGAIFFYADLLRSMGSMIEPAFCRAASYNENNTQTSKGVRVWVDDVPAAGRDILLIDDICDTGLTLLKLHQVFLDLGAKSVTSVVLIHRKIQASRYEPSFSAFEYEGPEWFVGYGFDDNGKYRNAPDVYRMDPVV